MGKMSNIRRIIGFIAAAALIALTVFGFIAAKAGEATGTLWAVLPPVIAIVLALVTREVYSSLFIGIVVGGFMAAGLKITSSVDIIVSNGLIDAVSNTAGIFVFLVILGVLVALMNKAGGSAAFGRWAQKHIKTKIGASFATFALGVLIFIDDYFNCLTVGSVMRPVTDTHKISRVKLAYLIDATAAPVCMIAPISSWAAAVSQYADGTEYSGIELFVRAIPYNFYSLLTFVFIITIILMKLDYGPMKKFELKAQDGDLGGNKTASGDTEEAANPKGRVIDLILPIALLIIVCVVALVYVGGYFGTDIWGGTENAGSFIGAFGNTDATVGLPWGSLIVLVAVIIYLICRRIITFREAMECIPKGFIAMVPAILILTFATALKNITGLLDIEAYVHTILDGAGSLVTSFVPAIVFVVACLLSFSTGTSWGTFGILIPIVLEIFPASDPLMFISMSACLAGAVCGDHCSPISDTTIMSSAGAQCNHVDHVSTQLPYALTVAGVSFVSFILAGFVKNALISLGVAVLLMIGTLVVIKLISSKKNKV